jgi:hypothetical protein
LNHAEIGNDFLEILKFYFNHTPFERSRKPERIKKSPAEVMENKIHPHWLSMINLEPFKKAA